MDIKEEIKIENMQISDLDLISDNLKTEYDDFWNYNVLKSELDNENSKYIVAKIDNNIIGFAGIWIAIDIAHITNIVVKKDCRKSGIGSLLLENLISLCNELQLKEITLEVNEHNNIAIKLYENFCFKHVRIKEKIL